MLIFNTLGAPKNLGWITGSAHHEWVRSLGAFVADDLEEVLPGSSSLAQDFVKFMLVMDPGKRPCITDVIDHPFLKSHKKNSHYKKCPLFSMSLKLQDRHLCMMKSILGTRYLIYKELMEFQKSIDSDDKYRASLDEMNGYYIGMLVERFLRNAVAKESMEILPFGIGNIIHSYCTIDNYSISDREIQGVGKIITYQWKKANQEAEKVQSETCTKAPE